MERIATGGMAEVYRAKASGAGGFEKQLAIKRILPSYSQNEEFRRMFEYEARLSSHLTQANIVQIYDFVKAGETYLLSMEFVDGKNLRQFLNKIKKLNITVPFEFCLYTINEVCKGLEYAHNKRDELSNLPLNIIHRDMSPQNIMLSYEGSVKIVDFGIAKAKDRVDETRSGVIKGKFGYMSPEQANAETVDHRTDIFSTGIILFELLTNRRLFSADSDMATLKLIQTCIVPPPSKINPKISPELEKIVMKALAKDFKLRYNNASQFHQSIQEYLGKHYPSFTQKNAAEFIQKVFETERQEEKKRFEQIYKQSIPFSQGESQEGSAPKQVKEFSVDGDVTKSESASNTDVTFSENDKGEFSESFEEELSMPSSANIQSQEKTQAQTQAQSQEKTQQNSISQDKTRVDNITHSKITTKAKKVVPPPPPKTISTIEGFEPQTNSVKLSSEDTHAENLKTQENTFQQIANAEPKFLNPNKTYEINIGNLSSERSERNDRTPLVAQSNPYQRPVRKAKKSKTSNFFWMGFLVAGTYLVYQFVLNGGLMTFLTNEQEREITQAEQATPKTEIPKPVAPAQPQVSVGQCVVEVGSDPSGSVIMINGVAKDKTPTSISIDCKKSFDIALLKDGYEAISENIFASNRVTKIYKTLKKIPQGKLELQLSQNAKIFINGLFIKEIRANEPTEITLKAGKVQKVRFVNEIFNIDTEKEFVVQPDTLVKKTIKLEPKN
jgi:serine/threonine protein kinase